MSVMFWITASLVATWLIIRLAKLHIINSVEDGRMRILRDLGPLSPALQHDQPPLFLGFFHPYCNAGGGGERVLWTAIRDIQNEFPNVICIVYTGDLDATKEQILSKIRSCFGIQLDPRALAFVYLRKRFLVEDSLYPRLTLLLQSLASMVLGLEAISQLVPDVYFDTMGYAFTYPVIRFFTSAKIAAYVHYPTISSDMLQRVQERRTQYNNSGVLAKSFLWTTGKIIYYRLFAKVYGWCGSFSEITMVNSTWTKGHIDSLWHTDAEIVYPPCDTERLNELSLEYRKPKIVSVAQFRPEKDHAMQLAAVARLFEKYPRWKAEKDFELVLVGSSRNQEDEKRIASLRVQCEKLSIQDHVRFEVNAPYDVLVASLGQARVGLHTMWNEHFGIGVVEYMAAGLIPVAHNSGGPKMDIVTPVNGKKTGYLADTVETFADRLNDALSLSEDEFRDTASTARASASDKFSEVAFHRDVMRPLRNCLT